MHAVNKRYACTRPYVGLRLSGLLRKSSSIIKDQCDRSYMTSSDDTYASHHRDVKATQNTSPSNILLKTLLTFNVQITPKRLKQFAFIAYILPKSAFDRIRI